MSAKSAFRAPKAFLMSAATFWRSSHESTSALMVMTLLPMVSRNKLERILTAGDDGHLSAVVSQE